MKIIQIFLLTFIFSTSAFAAYTANHKSTIKWVKIYNSDIIYFQLDDQPTTDCSYSYFVLNNKLTENQRNRYYTTLLAARASGQEISVGYDRQQADCLYDTPIVYAVAF